MKSIKEKRIVIPLLIAACIVIWSRNILLFFSNPEAGPIEMNPEEILITGDAEISLEKEGNAYIYSPKYRDPFKSWIESSESRMHQSERQQPVTQIVMPAPVPPHLRFCGLVRDNRGTLAVVEDSKGEIFYVFQGDTINQVRIIGISDDSLHCRWEKLTFKIPLQL